MAVQKAAGALMDAQAAAEAEGIFEPTADQKKMLLRHRALSERERVIAAEKAAIEKTIREQMDSVGARALAVNGKNWVLFSPVNQQEFYEDQMTAAYPEVVATFYQAKADFDKKKAEFTFSVRKDEPRRTFKP